MGKLSHGVSGMSYKGKAISAAICLANLRHGEIIQTLTWPGRTPISRENQHRNMNKKLYYLVSTGTSVCQRTLKEGEEHPV